MHFGPDDMANKVMIFSYYSTHVTSAMELVTTLKRKQNDLPAKTDSTTETLNTKTFTFRVSHGRCL